MAIGKKQCSMAAVFMAFFDAHRITIPNGVIRFDGWEAAPCRLFSQKGLGQANILVMFTKWSGRQDSNLRPSAPKADALPDCATPRGRASWRGA